MPQKLPIFLSGKAAVVILALIWAALYLPNLRTNPGWYGDETIALTAAHDLMRGDITQRAMMNTFWHPYAPYQPGYLYVMGVASVLTGWDIWGPRLVNALLALATACLMALYGRPVLGILPAFLAGVIFLTYDQTVLHFRWIFTHNPIAFGFTLTFLALCRRSSRQTDWLAGIGLAIGAAALPLFVYGAIPSGLWRLRHPRAWLRLVLPPTLVVISSLAFGALAHRPLNFLANDLAATMEFYAEASTTNSGSLAGIATNIWLFFTHDVFHVLAGIAVLLCWNRPVRAIGFGAVFVAFLLLQNRQNLTVFYYQAILLLPLLCLALGNLIRRLMVALRKTSGGKVRGRFAPACALVVVLSASIPTLTASWAGGLISRNHYWVTQSPAEVETAAEWINRRVAPGDLVICHHNIAWLLKCRTADYLMVTTWEGLPTWPYHSPLPREQFEYPADVSTAKYLVVGDIDARWTFFQPNVQQLLEQVVGPQGWQEVWRGSTYAIFGREVE